MGALVDAIAEDPQAIGYSVYYYVTYQSPFFAPKLVDVDGVGATSATIGDGEYPFVAPVWVILREDQPPRSTARILRDWLVAADGQSVVALSGYVETEPAGGACGAD